MEYGWHDLIGNAGVFLILICYLNVQVERMDVRSIAYSGLNGLGAALILLSLVFEFNLSAFLMEFAWLAISIYGLWRARTGS